MSARPLKKLPTQVITSSNLFTWEEFKMVALAERLYFDYPYVGGILDEIAQSYEHEARWQDSEANISKRLRD